MTCNDLEHQLGAYIDQELDAAARHEVEQHLRECPDCASSYARHRALGTALREQLPTFSAPDLLRARVEGALRVAHALPEGTRMPSRVSERRWRWAAAAATVLFVISAGYGVVATQRAESTGAALTRDVLSSHVRSLMPDHLTDVASSDQHTVKPWFNGRLDYSPPVYDLAGQGFPLIGGRLDYVGDRTVAALVYQRRKHVVNLFVWPTERGDAGAPELTRQGYHLLHWTRAGMTYWVVSDLNEAELREFARLQQRTDSLATLPDRS